MTTFFYIAIYFAVAVFLAACAVRTVSYARAPIHLRWELYPVPHDDPALVKHGGSYFEVTDWWKFPLHVNHLGDLKVMVPEILLLRGLKKFNPALWYSSFPFHFGLYLLIGSIAMVFVHALLPTAAVASWIVMTATVLRDLILITGVLGSGLSIVGAIGLLVRRFTDAKLRNYTTPADIFNLIFFIAAFGFLWAGYFLRQPSQAGPLAIAHGLLHFDRTVPVSVLLAVGLGLSAVLLAYIPLTHMSHFIAKYFTYHSVRWDDEPNRPGSKIAVKIAEYLTYRPTWSAAHVGADGSKTWVEVVSSAPPNLLKKEKRS
ncbi:MAG: hypothetical protein RB191_22125 [Terriglobia bacterium]|nr:hypothetical protein [Terriglobia bacterium]